MKPSTIPFARLGAVAYVDGRPFFARRVPVTVKRIKGGA